MVERALDHCNTSIILQYFTPLRINTYFDSPNIQLITRNETTQFVYAICKKERADHGQNKLFDFVFQLL